MTNPIHVMPSAFDNSIVAGRMRKDSSGRYVSTGDLCDVTEEAVHAAVYRFYRIAKDEGTDRIAYEFDMRNGDKFILAAKIEKVDE